MICLIQRVTHAQVVVDSQLIGKIQTGLVVLTAFQSEDSVKNIDKMVHKLLNYRCFSDNEDKMNLNVQQVEGALLLIPQFTLAATTNKGLRPSFSSCAAPDTAHVLFDAFVNLCKQSPTPIETGLFGADMQVSLTNNGPVTFWLET
ncbi:MAG: D-tyrosyl-tRNA(Tyr) deacylase [Gammaproteobacteria bacterium]|nr:D-tyrosyl-tRNA(Tyr) deacylase [Gammaproteobacteria bacterium]